MRNAAPPFLALLLALALAALALPAPPAAAAPKADPKVHARVARILEAYGGRAKLEAVKAWRIEGTLFSAMRHAEVPTTRVFARPDRFKSLIDYPEGIEARIVDGRRGWRMNHGAPLVEAEGPMLLAMELQAARSNLPWLLAEREADAREIEPRREDGETLPGLEIALREGLVLRVWTHPRTHLVLVSQGALRTGGAFTSFENFFSDFREVEGVKFAFHEENFASGAMTGVTTVTRVVVNPRLGPAEFRPPSPPDSLAARPRERTRG